MLTPANSNVIAVENDNAILTGFKTILQLIARKLFF